ncbi:LLM class flavin-dependent oxidoreductase [Actinotalea ferrariae]|uniref:LLM class flavin-dependent oxidoreductase n=1 Tax=Actinotalea ferrariae TaxID=1386098 RepID=UPI001C8C43DF|nr:LLM class flavin-dependent oxidoreductase [Actinotalea ferrariae]MBX9244433.1 LLM class flavin-dependent oxidoreductase [Actinotalea ferrariae]
MRYGFVGSYGSVAEVVRMAEEAEAHGWDGFFTWDGISIGPMDTWDPWTLLGAVAVRTSSVRLGAMIFPLARRRPWKVAREALTVDHLSGGRLVLPVGLGVTDDGGFGRVAGEAQTLRERAERLDEALAILDLASTGEPFSFKGVHHRVDGLQIAPRPVQRPRVPVWPVVAVGRPRSMARAARWDGAVLQGSGGEPSPQEVATSVAWFRARRDERRAQGEPVPDAFDVVQQGVLPDDRGAAREHAAALAEAGATWWVESRWDPTTATPEALLAAIRQGPPR